MFSRTTIPHTLLLLTSVAAFGAGVTQPASAGPLCDWLFGGNTAPAYPTYAAQYPAYAAPAPTYAAQYPAYAAPAYAAPTYAAQYPSYVSQPATYSAGYAPAVDLSPTNYSTNYTAAMPAAVNNGATALQMPAYGSGATQTTYYGSTVAPSTYSAYAAPVGTNYPAPRYAAPADRGYSAFTPPVRGTYPNSGVPVTSYYGTGNVYPDFPGTTATVASPPVMPASGTVTAYQAPVPPAGGTVQTYPGVPASKPGLFGGLCRFFGSCFGTGYSSSYNKVPVTYYRPATTVDAVGQTQIVQQPCTSYQYQLQRAPYTTFQPSTAAPAPAVAPSTSNYCPPGTSSGFNPYAGGGYESSAVPGTNQVLPPQGNQVMPPGSGGGTYYPAPSNSAPSGYPGGVPSNPDYNQVPAPSLSPPPLNTSNRANPFGQSRGTPASSSTRTSPYDDSRSPADAADDPYGTARGQQPPTGARSNASEASSLYGEIRPLPAGDRPYAGGFYGDGARGQKQPLDAPQQYPPRSDDSPQWLKPEDTPAAPGNDRVYPPSSNGDRVASTATQPSDTTQRYVATHKAIEWPVQRASFTRVSEPRSQQVRPAEAIQPTAENRPQANPTNRFPSSSRSIDHRSTSPDRSYDSLGWSSRPRR